MQNRDGFRLCLFGREAEKQERVRFFVVLPGNFRKFLCNTRSATLDDEFLAAAIQSDARRNLDVAVAAFNLRVLANI